MHLRERERDGREKGFRLRNQRDVAVRGHVLDRDAPLRRMEDVRAPPDGIDGGVGQHFMVVAIAPSQIHGLPWPGNRAA
jgi:hypothetical protein